MLTTQTEKQSKEINFHVNFYLKLDTRIIHVPNTKSASKFCSVHFENND